MTHFARSALISGLTFAIASSLTLSAVAQTPPPAPTIAQIVAANGKNTKAMTAALRAIVVKNPKAAQEVVDAAAAATPEVAAALAQMLSSIQRGMRETNPDGAKQIAAIVSTAPAAFQAAYAVALAPGNNGANGNSGANDNNNTGGDNNNGQGNTQTANNTGGAGGSGFGAGGSSNIGGFGGSTGGGVISPVRP